MLEKLKKVLQKFKNNALDLEIKPLIVLDVGCRWGFADKFISDDMDNIIVYGFDPDIDECARLNKLYQNENIRLVPIGLANKPGKRILYLTSEPACSSLYKPDINLTTNYPALYCAKETSQVSINVSTLDIWAKEKGITYVDYIKIDTQGAELSILKGGIKTLKSVRFLEVEVEFNPIYEGQPIFSEVDSFLRKYGFVLWKLSNLVHYAKGDESEIIMRNDSINYDRYKLEYQTRGGQLYWADAFYIKKNIVNVIYESGSVEEIKRDAAIASRLGFLDLKLRLETAYKER